MTRAFHEQRRRESTEIQARIALEALGIHCTYPKCCNTRRTRGLCHGHYQVMRDRVRNGRVSEVDLVRRGLLLPAGQGGSPAQDHLRAFEAGSDVLSLAEANARRP